MGTFPVVTSVASRAINAPPSRVYRAYTEFSRWPEWVPHFSAVIPLMEGALAPGFKGRITLKPVPLASTWEVTEVDPGRSFVWQYSLLGVRFVFHHIVGTVGGRTVATLRADIHGPLAWLGAFASPHPKIHFEAPPGRPSASCWNVKLLQRQGQVGRGNPYEISDD